MQGNIHNISTTYTDACDNDTAKLVLLLLYVAPREPMGLNEPFLNGK